MQNYNHYLNLINEAIGNIRYPEQPAQLYAPIAYTMSLGGKRIRPVLTLMTCEAMGGDPSHAINAALGIELFHNFTLLHDDVMDRALVRRGKPTVHVKWNDNVAILSGDAMLTMATQIVSRVDDDLLRPILDLFNTTAMEIYEGQQWDMDFEQRSDVTVDEYINMIRLKTSVLLGCACKTGAIVAHADERNASLIYNMAVNLGLAFQLQDDYLDVWGDPATFGKETGGDISNNKKTFLLINAMNRATGDDATELEQWLNIDESFHEQKIAAVTAIYERLGLKELSRQAIEDYSQRAINLLAQVDMSDDARQAFQALIAKLINREK
jgi:geranylgeranyl diphosphate synthase type II